MKHAPSKSSSCPGKLEDVLQNRQKRRRYAALFTVIEMERVGGRAGGGGVLRLRSEWEGERHATKGGCLAQAVMWEGDV